MAELFLVIVKFGTLAIVFATMFGIGLHIAPADFRFLRDRPLTILGSLLVVTLLVPVAVVAIVFAVKPIHEVAVGLAIMAAAPAAPLALGKMRASSGSLVYAANLQLSVAVLAPLTTPLVLAVLRDVLEFRASLDPLTVARQVVIAQMLPIGLGIVLRAIFPKLGPIGTKLVVGANRALLALMAVALIFTYQMFLGIAPRSYIAIVAFALAALALGHFLGPSDPDMKGCLAIEASMRNPGLALLIANLNFPGQNAVAFVLPCVAVVVLIVTVYATWQSRRRGPTPAPAG